MGYHTDFGQEIFRLYGVLVTQQLSKWHACPSPNEILDLPPATAEGNFPGPFWRKQFPQSRQQMQMAQRNPDATNEIPQKGQIKDGSTVSQGQPSRLGGRRCVS